MQEALLRAWNRRNTLRTRSDPFSTTSATCSMSSTPPPDEQAALLRAALFSLPEKYRVPLTLNLLEGYTLQEIASLLSLPLGTVKTRVARAKHKLEQEVSSHAQ